MSIRLIAVILLGVVFYWPHPAVGHGRLWEPPGRSTMWRRGFNTPINYQDNELFCGGFQHQLSLGYKCGICGDPYDRARENEAGGKYATGTIARTYTQGQEVTFQVDLTANHKGFFEFKICPTNDPKVKATQECLDLYPVALADGSGSKFIINFGESFVVDVRVVLPQNLTCEFCVLQWRYHAGNSWGTDPDGKSCVGCGPQEEFYGCADIKILPSRSSSSTDKPKDVTSSPNDATSTKSSSGDSGAGGHAVDSGNNNKKKNNNNNNNNKPTSGSGTGNGDAVGRDTNGDMMVCRGNRAGLDGWCQANCQLGFCPPELCTCERKQYEHTVHRPAGCRAAGIFAGKAGMDDWCKINCEQNYCPPSHCVC